MIGIAWIKAHRGRAAFMLSEGGQGNPGAWVWFGVDDVKSLYASFNAKGAMTLTPPTNLRCALESPRE